MAKITTDEIQVSGSYPGAIAIKASRCEIEGRRTVHIDCFAEFPYGHLAGDDVRNFAEWMYQASTWVKGDIQ